MSPRLGLLIIPFVLFIFLLSSVSKPCEGRQAEDIPLPPQFRGPSEVVIINGLVSKENLTVHCKSKNNDLGPQLLHPNGNFSFSFEQNFWGTTLFFCGFTWGNEFHWFDIYAPYRAGCNTPSPCLWNVIASGPCRWDYYANQFSNCYPWNVDNKSLRFEMLRASHLLPTKSLQKTNP